jgi:signal transduction histidine kinase
VQSLLFIVDVIISLALVTIGIFVLSRNTKALSNRLYFCITIFAACWIVSNYFSNDRTISQFAALVANHLVLFFPGLVLCAFLGFATCFTNMDRLTLMARRVAALSCISYLLVLTPWVVRSIVPQENVYAINFGPLVFIYILTILVNVGLSFFVLYRASRTLRGIERQRSTTIFWSLFVTIVVNLFTNLGLPLLNNSYLLTNIGPLSAVFIVIGSTYAILKHHLFDIRFFVLRTTAYAASTLVLGMLYVLPALLILAALADVHMTPRRFFVGLFVLTVAGLVFRQTKGRFDDITSKLFFRGYYEPQDVLRQLSTLLAETINLGKITGETKKIFAETLKTDLVDFVFINQGDKKLLTNLSTLFSKSHLKVIFLDEIENHTHIIEYLRGENIAAVVKLKTTHEELGFMILGYKESGELYGDRDRKLLSIAGDEIAVSLQNALHFEEIQRFNTTLQSRVEEATRQLRRTNTKLEALDETKDDFISMASHQLRTPLTSVKGYLSMVIEGDAGTVNETQRKMLNQAFISSQRMVYLIADLLNVSRLKTGKFIIDWAPVDLSKVIQEEISQLVETAESRGIALTYKKPADFPVLNMDETKTRQVIMNFVDNAIYYTPSGGHIDVQLVDKGASIELKIVDDGIGVPKLEQHHLFTKFYRARNAQKARPDGTGLGLFMAKKVVVAQGGAIIFESKEGQGSTFGFSFAKARLNPTNNLQGAPAPAKTTPLRKA